MKTEIRLLRKALYDESCCSPGMNYRCRSQRM